MLSKTAEMLLASNEKEAGSSLRTTNETVGQLVYEREQREKTGKKSPFWGQNTRQRLRLQKVLDWVGSDWETIPTPGIVKNSSAISEQFGETISLVGYQVKQTP